jgi:pteridine reductase
MPPAKVALVTGSGKRRVGFHVALALAQRGYKLVVHYHRSAAEAQATVADFRARGSDALAVQADLSDDGAARAMVQQAIGHFGRLDVLVNCAAIYESRRLEDVTAADVRRYFEVNALGSFVCSQQAGLAMVQQAEGGNIVLFGDWAEARPYLDFSAYFPSKGAVTAMTRSLAVELGARNPRVRVNCVLPGPVLFPPDLPEEERQQAIDATIVKHAGRPENVAQAVLFFIDNDFVTGVCLPVDGGRTIGGIG